MSARTNLLVLLVTLTGCGNKLRSTVAPEFQRRTVPISRIGVGGPGASIASQEFIAAGYKTVDVGTSITEAVAIGRQQGVPFVATVDPIDTSQAVWNGFYSFSMRVSETPGGSIVWSSSATYGQGGMFINLQKSSRDAYKAMVQDFATTFPPQR
jgi:hypothetical protein